MESRIKLGISACLLGQEVRYDGTHQLNRFLTESSKRRICAGHLKYYD